MTREPDTLELIPSLLEACELVYNAWVTGVVAMDDDSLSCSDVIESDQLLFRGYG